MCFGSERMAAISALRACIASSSHGSNPQALPGQARDRVFTPKPSLRVHVGSTPSGVPNRIRKVPIIPSTRTPPCTCHRHWTERLLGQSAASSASRSVSLASQPYCRMSLSTSYRSRRPHGSPWTRWKPIPVNASQGRTVNCHALRGVVQTYKRKGRPAQLAQDRRWRL